MRTVKHKIKKGDSVIVIAGKDKGKQSTVAQVLGDRLLLQDVNLVKKHVRPNPQKNDRGGIVPVAKPIHCSNVMIYDANKQKRSRVGIRVTDDSKRVRYLKASNELV